MSAGLIMWPRPFTSPMTLVLDFHGQILTLSYLGIGKGDSTYITEAVWVDRKLDPLHVRDLKVWPWTWISRSNFENAVCCYTHSDLDPWPWTRSVKLKLSKSYISATGGSLDIERKAYEYDAMWAPLCQLELWPQLLLDSEYLDFHGKISKWLYLWNGWTYWYETRGI